MPECSIWHHGGDREEQACCKPGAPAMPSCAPRVLLCCCLALQQVIWAANQMKLHSAKSLNRPRIRFSSAGVNCIGESSYAIQEWPTRLFPHNWLAGPSEGSFAPDGPFGSTAALALTCQSRSLEFGHSGRAHLSEKTLVWSGGGGPDHGLVGGWCLCGGKGHRVVGQLLA